MAASVSRNLNGLQPGTSYVVQVRAKDGDNNTSEWSNSYSFTTPADPIATTNTTIIQYISGPSAGLYSGSNMYINSLGLWAWAPGNRTSPTVRIDTLGNASFAGTIYAQSGSIGGFTIAGDRLTSGTGSTRVGVAGGASGTAAGYAFWAGNDNPASAPFSVTNAGYVTASNLVIANSVTVGSYGGLWAGITPAASITIFSGATASSGTNATFWVTSTGSVYSTGGASFSGPIISTAYLTGQLNSSASIVGGAIYVPSASAPLFSVDTSGNLIATSASINGRITASSGSIGGWNIAPSVLSSGSGSTAVGVSSSGTYAFWAGASAGATAAFSVTNTGVMTATNANISGTLTATTGSVGGFTITQNQLWGGSGASFVGFNPYNASAAIFAGGTASNGGNAQFYVSNLGILYAVGANISGSINASAGNFSGSISAASGIIGGFTIGLSSLSASNIILSSSSGLNLGNNQFTVNQSGAMVAQNASVSGSITANAGSIGGFTLSNSSLSATNIVLSSSSGLNLGNNQFTVSQSGAMVAQSASITGQITAQSGTIAGWTITGEEIATTIGKSRIALNSGSITNSPKIYIGSGNFGSNDTPFYVDASARFSLGNQFVYTPGTGTSSVVAFPSASAYFNGASLTISSSNTGIIQYTAVTGVDLPVNTIVNSVSVTGASTIFTLNNTSTSSGNFAVTFSPVDYSTIAFSGKISGIVESINPVSPLLLSATVNSASISSSATTGSILFTASGGHSLTTGLKVIYTGFPATASGLNGLSGSVVNVPNSTQFYTLNPASVVSGSYSYTGASTTVSLQELTMGMQPSENTGTAYAHTAGPGIRLDQYNWWLTNNQFRVGNAATYFNWNGTQFTIQGGGAYTLGMGVGATAASNYYSVFQVGTTPTYSSSTTPFYVSAVNNGQMSLGNKLTWDGATLSVTGSVTASAGSIGGFTIASDKLSASGPGTYVGVAGSGTYAFFAGNATASAAPFSVTNTGTLVSNTGQIGSPSAAAPWYFGTESDNNSAVIQNYPLAQEYPTISGTYPAAMEIDSSGYIEMHPPGSACPSPGLILSVIPSSPAMVYYGTGLETSMSASNTFYVTKTGQLFATNAVISGNVTASSGNLGGWLISASGIYSLPTSGNLFKDNTFNEVNTWNNTETSNIDSYSYFDSSASVSYTLVGLNQWRNYQSNSRAYLYNSNILGLIVYSYSDTYSNTYTPDNLASLTNNDFRAIPLSASSNGTASILFTLSQNHSILPGQYVFIGIGQADASASSITGSANYGDSTINNPIGSSNPYYQVSTGALYVSSVPSPSSFIGVSNTPFAASTVNFQPSALTSFNSWIISTVAPGTNTASVTGSAIGLQTVNPIFVESGASYVASVYTRSASVAATGTIKIDFYPATPNNVVYPATNSYGVSSPWISPADGWTIITSSVSASPISTSSFSRLSVSAIAPVGAAWAMVSFYQNNVSPSGGQALFCAPLFEAGVTAPSDFSIVSASARSQSFTVSANGLTAAGPAYVQTLGGDMSVSGTLATSNIIWTGALPKTDGTTAVQNLDSNYVNGTRIFTSKSIGSAGYLRDGDIFIG